MTSAGLAHDHVTVKKKVYKCLCFFNLSVHTAMLNDLYLSFHLIMHRFESFTGDTNFEIAVASSEKRNFQRIMYRNTAKLA